MGNDTPIKSALAPREWASPHHSIQCYDSWTEEVAAESGVAEISAGPDYLHLTSHEHPKIADFSAPSDRHALAALALHGQPFGFTWEDVSELRKAASEMTIGRSWVEDVADRIAALLPPRE